MYLEGKLVRKISKRVPMIMDLGLYLVRFLVAFLSQDSDTARTSGLAECAKAVNKTNLGRRLLNMHETKAFMVTVNK